MPSQTLSPSDAHVAFGRQQSELSAGRQFKPAQDASVRGIAVALQLNSFCSNPAEQVCGYEFAVTGGVDVICTPDFSANVFATELLAVATDSTLTLLGSAAEISVVAIIFTPLSLCNERGARRRASLTVTVTNSSSTRSDLA